MGLEYWYIVAVSILCYPRGFTSALPGARSHFPASLVFLLWSDIASVSHIPTTVLYCGLWFASFQRRFAQYLHAVLISHADLNHLGGLPYAYGALGLRCPIYATTPVFQMGQMFLYDFYQVGVCIKIVYHGLLLVLLCAPHRHVLSA